jgi:hypothetical protein
MINLTQKSRKPQKFFSPGGEIRMSHRNHRNHRKVSPAAKEEEGGEAKAQKVFVSQKTKRGCLQIISIGM